MASIDRFRRELIFKIVFYGPGLGGKTTTLRHIHATTKPENRGNMVSLATETDRTLYFDFLPVRLLRLGEMTVKLQLYTVPGQVFYAATRKLVLNGADAIVFVADTQLARLDANHDSLDDLNANLAEQGRKLSAVPHAFQWNKRDLPEISSVDELDRRLNLFGAPSVATVATTGEGVFETLEKVTRLAVDAYRAELPQAARTPGVPMFLDAEEIGLTDAIKGLTNAREPTTASDPRRPAIAKAAAAEALAVEARKPSAPRVEPGDAFSSMPTPPPSDAVLRGLHALKGGDTVGMSGTAEPLPSVAIAPVLSTAGTGASVAGRSVDAGFSLAELWPSGDRDAVRSAEAALAAGDTVTAVAACEDLVSRVLASASMVLGGQAHPRDPAIVVTLLGLDGARYLGFRGIARSARSKRTLAVRDAMECYAFAVEARRALDRASRGT